jgi:hypothetical protein
MSYEYFEKSDTTFLRHYYLSQCRGPPQEHQEN